MNKGLACVGIAAAASLFPWLFGVNSPVAHAAAGDAKKGKVVYEKSCVLCHGPQGRGDGPVGKTVIPPAADFTSAASKKKPDAELLATIENGRPSTAMVAWKGQLSEAEIQDVLAYVNSLRR
ncbi:MAG: cytochrome c [Nitrospira sp.]|nr:cytochrome c [Nitrospira sp.]